MGLSDWINAPERVARAILAIPAIPTPENDRTLATLAPIALAESKTSKNSVSFAEVPEEPSPPVAPAEKWLSENMTELQGAGFTDRDIYGQGWFTGIADLSLWQIENLEIELRGDQLCFRWFNGHQEIGQSCRPEQWRR